MHYGALTSEAKGIYPLLTLFSGFYLAGGTALALQIGHRVSVDFDLFSPEPIKKTLFNQVENVFSGQKIEISVNNKDELTVFINKVKITFLYYSFNLIEKTEQFDGLSFVGINEIAAMKAYTIGRRGSWKDYLDLYFIINNSLSSLDKIITLAKQKYGDIFNDRLFLEQLIYLADVDDIPIIFLKEKVNKEAVTAFFEQEIKKLKF